MPIKSSGVLLRDGAARAVVLAANGAETPRLLFMSVSTLHPDGLANASGFVGKNLMFNFYSQVWGDFPERLNEYKRVVATRDVMDFYDFDPGGRRQPTMTIQALPFRAADRITALARAVSI